MQKSTNAVDALHKYSKEELEENPALEEDGDNAATEEELSSNEDDEPIVKPTHVLNSIDAFLGIIFLIQWLLFMYSTFVGSSIMYVKVIQLVVSILPYRVFFKITPRVRSRFQFIGDCYLTEWNEE